MTGDELAARLYAEQGYLVAACDSPREIGSIAQEWTKVPLKTRDFAETPVRIVAKSNRGERNMQAKLASRILGAKLEKLSPEFKYFYRVEAAD